MKAATRARKEQFIASFGEIQTREAILALFFRSGLAALTDDQIDEITSDMAGAERERRHRNAQNRLLTAGRAHDMRLNAAA